MKYNNLRKAVAADGTIVVTYENPEYTETVACSPGMMMLNEFDRLTSGYYVHDRDGFVVKPNGNVTNYGNIEVSSFGVSEKDFRSITMAEMPQEILEYIEGRCTE